MGSKGFGFSVCDDWNYDPWVIVEKTPKGMLLLVTALIASSVYPIMYLTDFSDPKRRKMRWLRLFTALATVIILAGIIGLEFWPSPRIRITKIEQFPLAANSPVEVNLTLRNDGRDARIVIQHKVFFVDLLPHEDNERSEMEEKLWEQFKMHPQFQSPMDILNDEETWTTVGGNFILSKDQFERLSPAKTESLYLMGKFHYTERISEKDLDFCLILPNRPGVIVRCSHHNGVSQD